MGLCKIKSKKKKKKVEKNGHKDVRSIENNGYKDAHHEKKERDGPCSCKIFSTFNKKDMSQGAK
jgi:hypothetical protein